VALWPLGQAAGALRGAAAREAGAITRGYGVVCTEVLLQERGWLGSLHLQPHMLGAASGP
jgi:hypothetical protein